MHKRMAAVDVGTNSILYLVADITGGEIAIIEEGERITRLGRGISHSRILTREAMELSAEAIDTFCRRARELGAHDIYLTATSAVRDAENKKEFIRIINAKTGYELIVLSGDEEASVTFAGASSTLQSGEHRLSVIDAGGGSTEFIKGLGGKIESKKSINVGHVRLTEQFIAGDVATEGEMEALQAYVKGEILKAGIPPRDRDEKLIGVGGTIATLAMIHLRLRRFDARRIHGCPLKRRQLITLRKRLQYLPGSQRMAIPGLKTGRADVIVAGAAIFECAMEVLDFDALVVSTWGLRHGCLLLKGS